MTRRGTTLLELVVAVAVSGMVVVAALAVQRSLDQTSRARAERAGAAANLRAAAGIFSFELGAVGIDSVAGPDLMSLGPSGVSFRAQRGLWLVCRLAADSIVVAAGRLERWRRRGLEVGRDSLLVYVAGDTAAEIDGWVPAPLLAGPTSSACPSGEPGLRFRTAIDTGAAAAGRLVVPTVARAFESVALATYGSAGIWQLGETGLSAGGTVQPVVGPLDGSAGVWLAGWDRLGGAPGRLDLTAGVDLWVRALARREVAVGPGRVAVARDSVLVRIGFEGVP